MKLIGLCGFKGSGKDTVGNSLAQYGFRKDSYARTLKDVCAILFSWDRNLLEGDTDYSRQWRETPDQWWSEKLGIPNFTPRLGMQLVGTDSLRKGVADNIWQLNVERRLNSETKTVIVDCRFFNEMELIKQHGGVIIEVQRSVPDWYDEAYSLSQKYFDMWANSKPIIYDHTHFATHISEWQWLAYPKDFIIRNHEDFDNIERQIKQIVT